MGRHRLRLAALLLTGLVSTAQAGDGSALHVLGFSADAEHFAFEQFGVRDASMHPYGELRLIETTGGGDREGGPFHVLIQDPEAEAETARAALDLAARPALDRLGISAEGMASVVNAAIRPTEELLPMDIWPTMAREVSEMALPASPLGAGRITLEQRPASSPYCAQIGAAARVIALRLLRDDGTSTTLHADTDLPDKRGCAGTYGIAGIYVRTRPDGAVSLVVIVSAYPRGFEEPNRRFLAFAARLSR